MKSITIANENTESIYDRAEHVLTGEFDIGVSSARIFINAEFRTRGGQSLRVLLEQLGLSTDPNLNGEYELQTIRESAVDELDRSVAMNELIVRGPLAVFPQTGRLVLAADIPSDAAAGIKLIKERLGKKHVDRDEKHGRDYLEIDLGPIVR